VAAGVLAAEGCAGGLVRATDGRVAIMGRVDRTDPSRVRVGYPGVTFRVRFEGPSLAARFSCTTGASRIAVLVDGGAPRVLQLAAGESEVPLAEGLGPGPHVVDVVHRTETWQGIVGVRGFVVGPGAKLLPSEPRPARRLLLVGDSVTCGEAIDRAPDCRDAHAAAVTGNGYLSYGMLLGRALGAEVHLVCYGGRGLVRDWRGKTNVLTGPQLFDAALPIDGHPVPWNHADYTPDVVIVSLGTNDFNLDLGPLPEREPFAAPSAPATPPRKSSSPKERSSTTRRIPLARRRPCSATTSPRRCAARVTPGCAPSLRPTTPGTTATRTPRAPSTKRWPATSSPSSAPPPAGSWAG